MESMKKPKRSAGKKPVLPVRAEAMHHNTLPFTLEGMRGQIIEVRPDETIAIELANNGRQVVVQPADPTATFQGKGAQVRLHKVRKNPNRKSAAQWMAEFEILHT